MTDPKPNNAATPPAEATATNNAVTNATDARKAYEGVVNTLTDIHRVGQARAIQTMWAMGKVVDEFLSECEKKAGSRYGSFGIDQLAEDLSQRDIGSAARSSLYHARKVFLTLSFDQIETLAQRGYSTNHVKTLLPLADDVRDRVHAEMVDPKTNQVISVTALQDKVKSIQMEAAKKAADRAIEGPSAAEQIENDVDAGPTAEGAAATEAQTGEEAAQENGYTGEDGEATPDAEGNPEADNGSSGPVDPEKAKMAAKGAPDYSKPPLPGVKKMTKQLQGIVTHTGDCAISLQEVPKIGFDSKVAANNWLQAREELSASLADAEKYITELKKLLDESAKNDGLAEFTADTAGEKQAKKKARKR